MDIKSKKAYALVFAMILIIVLGLASIGLYSTTEYITVETKLKEQQYVRGYYAAIAGLRYARVLLQDPVALFGDTVHDGEEYTAPGTDDFFDHIDVDPADLTITITEYDPGDPQWAVDNYQVTATYTY